MSRPLGAQKQVGDTLKGLLLASRSGGSGHSNLLLKASVTFVTDTGPGAVTWAPGSQHNHKEDATDSKKLSSFEVFFTPKQRDDEQLGFKMGPWFVLFRFCLLRPHLQHMEIPRLGVELELQQRQIPATS